MSKALSLQYYYNHDGSLDAFTELLTGFDAPLYFLLKDKVPMKDNPCEVFLKDITFYLAQYPDGSIHDIGFLDNSFNSSLFRLRYYTGKGKEALAQIEELLDSQEPVMILTDIFKIPFSKYYQVANTKTEGVSVHGHVFLAVYHDKNRLYYVEAPWNLNPENFIECEYNKSVGVINKKDLRYAFESFVSYITITLKEEGLFASDGGRCIIEKSIKNYDKRSFTSDGLIYSYGKGAIERLIDICKKEFLYLNQEAASCPLDLYDLLNSKFRDIEKRRGLLYEYIIKYPGNFNNSGIDSVAKILADIRTSWLDVNEMISRMYTEKRYLLDSSLEKQLSEILELEGQLNSELKKTYSFRG